MHQQSDTPASPSEQRLMRERRGLLRTLSGVLDTPMTILSFVWVGLLIAEFADWGGETLQTTSLVIWGLFLAHFVLEFSIAPHKVKYLKRNWLTAIALVLPAFRMLRAFRALRVLRAARVGRGVGVLRWITSLNRGMKATRHTLRRRGLSYVLALTLLVDLTGAAAIYQFENPRALHREDIELANPASAISSYGEAVWWTSMMMTTMGSDYFPKTAEGRVIALLLAVYAFAIFGYITATVASLIIQADRKEQESKRTDKPTSSEGAQLRTLVDELRADVARLEAALARSAPRSD